ncbi:hypothetical protein LOTGIDRAFT_238096, partial [Lottia gigantea]
MDDTKNSVEECFSNDNSCNMDDVVECKLTPPPRKKRKRGQRGPAIRYTEDQLTLLKSVYKVTSYPTKAHVQYLTRRTQLPATIVRRWFYQRRCREGLCGSLERIHLIPQSVPQADVASNAPNYKKFKTVLVQIQSPTRSFQTTPRSSSSRSSTPNSSNMTGDPFGHDKESFWQHPSEQTPSKANFESAQSMHSFPYENTFFDGEQPFSTSTPKSEIGVSDSGFISLADDSKSTELLKSPLTDDEPISSINDVYGYYHFLNELNDRSNSVVYRRGIFNENWSGSRVNLQENCNGSSEVTNSNFRSRDICDIDSKTSTLNSACGFDIALQYTSGASRSGSFHESEQITYPSTEENITTQPGRSNSDSKSIKSKPQQMITNDPVTILQYINYKELKKLGIGSDINYDDIPTLRTGETDPNLQHPSWTGKDIDDPCKVSRGSEFNTCTTYKSTYTQTNPEDLYLSEPPQAQGYFNTSDFNSATGLKTGFVPATKPRITTQNVPQSIAKYIAPFIHPRTNVLETRGESLNPNRQQTKCSTCSSKSNAVYELSSDLQQNHFNDASAETNVKETVHYQKLYEKVRDASSVNYSRKPRSQSVVVVHPPRNRVYQTMDGKSHSIREATLRHNQGLESGVYPKTQKSNEILKPRVVTMNPKAVQVDEDGPKLNNPKTNQNIYSTLPFYSQRCDDDVNGMLDHPAACDNLDYMDFAHSNAAGETTCPPSTDRSHLSNTQDSNNLTPSETLQPKSFKHQNIIKVIRVKKIPSESIEKQKTVSGDGLEAFLLNPELNCNINPDKCTMDDSKVKMSQQVLKENYDVACYFITKHSWKGKYKRIFSVGTHGITTYNPQSMEVTNQWPYNEFISIVPNVKAPSNSEFIITMRKGKKTDTMKFSTDHRADLLTEALRFRSKFAEINRSSKRFNAYKLHWSDTRVPILLEVNEGSVDQIDPASQRILCSYDYKDIEGLVQLSDVPGGVSIIYGGFSRLHLFALEQRDDLIKSIMETGANCVGVAIKQRKEPITMEQAQTHRLGKYSSDEALTSYSEFTVQKISRRHTDTVRRTLCLTETCLVERDPATYSVVTVKPLCDVFALIRDPDNPQKFSIEYVKGTVRVYLSTDRDALVASILDGVRASGNRDVCVRMTLTYRGFRLGPFTVPVDEEVESQHLKFIQQPPGGMSFAEAVNRFNANISYSGLLHAVTQDGLFAKNKEKLINAAIAGLLEKEGDQNTISHEELQAQFQALRRLVASKAGFSAFISLPRMRESVGLKTVKAFKRNNDGVTHAAIDMLCALMQPMHDDYDLRQEQMNKTSLLSSRKFLQEILEVFHSHVVHGTGALIISAMLDFLTFALCSPYSETTDGTHFDNLLEMVAANGRIIFKLFQ